MRSQLNRGLVVDFKIPKQNYVQGKDTWVMSSFFLLSSFLSFSPVLSDQASITQMAAVMATGPRWVGAGAGLTIPAPFGHLRATASRPGAIRPVVSRRKVGLHLSSPPLGAALSPQPETLQSALPSLNMGGWIFHGWPRGGRLAKDLTRVERETPGEQTGQLVPELSPHGADTWAPRRGARANEAFVGALSTPGARRLGAHSRWHASLHHAQTPSWEGQRPAVRKEESVSNICRLPGVLPHAGPRFLVGSGWVGRNPMRFPALSQRSAWQWWPIFLL